LRDQGLISSGLDLNRWESLMTTDELYSTNWLLAYEAKIKDWLPSQGKNDHIDEDAFFGTLKSHNVSFYDSTRQVTPIDSREFGDDEESEYDNDNEPEAYYFGIKTLKERKGVFVTRLAILVSGNLCCFGCRW
jgi:hypothetical protein